MFHGVRHDLGGGGGFGGPTSGSTGLLATKAIFSTTTGLQLKQIDVEERTFLEKPGETHTRSDGTTYVIHEKEETTPETFCTKFRAKCLTGTMQLILELTYGGYGSKNKKLCLAVYDLSCVAAAKHIGNCVVEIEVDCAAPKCYRQKTGEGESYKVVFFWNRVVRYFYGGREIRLYRETGVSVGGLLASIFSSSFRPRISGPRSRRSSRSLTSPRIMPLSLVKRRSPCTSS